MTGYSRATFAAALQEALSDQNPVLMVRQCLLRIVQDSNFSRDVEVDVVEEAMLLLDAAGDDERRLLTLAGDVRVLLMHASSDAAAEAMLRLVADRMRVSQVIEKHLTNVISQTAFLSFAAEQRWPPEMRRNITRISRDELRKLSEHLSNLNVPEIERLLLQP